MFLCFAFSSSAANELRERVYVQTDKKMYVSGELAWLKILTTDENGIPLDFSKVGYVELLDETGSKVQTKLNIEKGCGSGTLLLPAALPTGTYRLVGYTRYMQNESPDVFFEKIIGVVNPSSGQIAPPVSQPAGIFPESQTNPTPSVGIRVDTDQKSYAFRSRAELSIHGLPENIHTLSVSIAGRDFTSSVEEPGLEHWKSGLRSTVNPPITDRFPAEYEGHAILGQLIETATGKPAYDYTTNPIIAFPGNDIQFFSGQMDSLGRVHFYTKRATGYSELSVSAMTTKEPKHHLNIQSPYHSGHTLKPLPLLDLTRVDKNRLQDQSVGIQVQYAYTGDSLMRFTYPSPVLYTPYSNRYVMEEYRKFGTMEEVFTEYVTFVRFRNINKKRRLSVLQEKFGPQNANTLVLVDGIPIFDHDIVHQYNPLLLSRVDVYFDRFNIGNTYYNGIVALYTPNNNYPELAPDPFTRIIPYESPQANRIFFTPDYASGTDNRLPDYRHTLYWNADVQTDGKSTVTIPLYTSDLSGDFHAVVEGITNDGRVVYATADFQVK